MRRRTDVHPEPLDTGRLLGLIAGHDAGELTRREQIELHALIEDMLARRGTAIVPKATADIIARVEAGEDITLQEIEAATYSVWSGAISEYFEPEPIEPELEPA